MRINSARAAVSPWSSRPAGWPWASRHQPGHRPRRNEPVRRRPRRKSRAPGRGLQRDGRCRFGGLRVRLAQLL